MNLIVDEKFLKAEHEDNEFFNDKLVFYFNKFWDDYEKIILLSSINIKEYPILVRGVFCDIPQEFKNNNKIICYIIGVDKNENKIETNKIVIERRI